MAELSELDFEGKYNNSTTGLFKNNTTRDITPERVRTLVTDTKDSFMNVVDDAYTGFAPQVSTSGTNTYTATLDPAITAYANSQAFKIKFTNASSGASTLNLNGLGAKKLYVNPTTQADSGDVVDEQVYLLIYDAALDSASGGFLMIGGSGGGGGAVDSVNGATGTVVLDAGDIGFTPAGGVAATDVQSAIAELDTEKLAITNRVFGFAFSDEVTAITTGTAKKTLHFPYTTTIQEIWIALKTAQASGSIFTVDVNVNGSTILSTKLTIDNTEETSLTATTAAVISSASITKADKVTIDVDQVGNGTAVGGTIWFRG